MITDTLRQNLAPLILRSALGVIFLYHGWHKVNANFGTAWHQAEPSLPMFMQVPVAWGELIGGAAFIIGLWNRLAAAGIIVIMAGGIATVHYKNGFDITKGGYEYNVALIAMCLVLIIIGPGPLSIDRFLLWRKKK